jgi:hypothetical protein
LGTKTGRTRAGPVYTRNKLKKSKKYMNIEKNMIKAAEMVAGKIRMDRQVGYKSYGRLKLPSVTFAENSETALEIVRMGLERAGRGNAKVPRLKEGTVLDTSFSELMDPNVQTLGGEETLEPRIRMICTAQDDVPETWADFKISDEARMVNARLGGQMYPRSPFLRLADTQSRLFAISRNDREVTRVSELKPSGLGVYPSFAANLPFLAGGIIQQALNKEPALPKGYTPQIIKVRSVEGAVGSGQSDVGIIVVDEKDLKRRASDWRQGGLRPIPLEEGGKPGQLTFKNEVFFGDRSDLYLKDSENLETFSGYYNACELPKLNIDKKERAEPQQAPSGSTYENFRC